MEKRFQFGIRNLLGLTFWLSVCLGAITQLSRLQPSDFEGQPESMSDAALISLIVIFLIAPFMAICEVWGRPRSSLTIGFSIVMYGVVIGWCIFFVSLLLSEHN